MGMDQSNPRSFYTNLLIIMRLGGIFKVRFEQERLQLKMGHQEGEKKNSSNKEIQKSSLALSFLCPRVVAVAKDSISELITYQSFSIIMPVIS